VLGQFKKKIEDKSAHIGVVGLGYVGLPLSIAFLKKGYRVLGFDIDPQKATLLHQGKSYLKHISSESFFSYVKEDYFVASNDFTKVADVDTLILCVPTPLTESREPDMSYVINTVKGIAPYLKPGQLVSLESTTYPGTTDELVREILESDSGLEAGKDFFLVYSPEREDPGNATYHTGNIPKVVGGYSPDCLEAGQALYLACVEQVVPVSSTRSAEMVKLFENTYRSVNIALVNELKLLCQRLGMDVWEVIQAAATKPFGFQAFWPGPGLGGHCIPIDPFYLTWKARQVDMNTRFIELAGEINTAMPYHVVQVVQDALNGQYKPTNGASILILGVAYKPDMDDMRESPALKIIDLLVEKGAQVLYHDPHVPALHPTRRHNLDLKSSSLTSDLLHRSDCVLIVTDHKAVDYDFIAQESSLVVDTRHVMSHKSDNVIMA
jgi:UDP-N-acetyl-D-glucosamine dehydrogenase